jgi:hypothetical protein
MMGKTMSDQKPVLDQAETEREYQRWSRLNPYLRAMVQMGHMKLDAAEGIQAVDADYGVARYEALLSQARARLEGDDAGT